MESNSKNNIDLVEKNLDPISFFEKDRDFIFVYKKTEKLAGAVYMVTNLFSENEPMKWILRKKVSDLLSFMLDYKDTAESRHFDFVYNIRTKVLELVSLLEISLRGGLVSDMNFTILKQEFSNLALMFISSSDAQTKEMFQKTISRTFFDVPEAEVGKGHSLRTTSSVQRIQYGDVKDKNTLVVADNFKRSNRQNIIFNMLKRKKELTIKDIAQTIKDCSEKTIQRELISLIRAGVLKKVGQRRWSKYSFV